jgi:hypothetical protein
VSYPHIVAAKRTTPAVTPRIPNGKERKAPASLIKQIERRFANEETGLLSTTMRAETFAGNERYGDRYVSMTVKDSGEF